MTVSLREQDMSGVFSKPLALSDGKKQKNQAWDENLPYPLTSPGLGWGTSLSMTGSPLLQSCFSSLKGPFSTARMSWGRKAHTAEMAAPSLEESQIGAKGLERAR